MPWQLTTPYSGGDLDPSGVYNQVKIRVQSWDDRRNMMAVELEYGTTSAEGKWVAGIVPASKPTYVPITGQDYVDLATNSTPNVGEKTYDAVKRGLYEYLSIKGLLDPGSIV